MGYEDGFYTYNNIIGYTGKIDAKPTVYFRQGNKFGRITQTHELPDNIGRNETRVFADYKIDNTGRGGVAREYYDGRYRHQSRAPFVPVNNESEKLELAKSIKAYTLKKSKITGLFRRLWSQVTGKPL